MRYGWPEAAYLVSTLGSRDEFCRFLVQLVENCTGFVWNFLPFCIAPIVERIKSEDGLASDATPALRNARMSLSTRLSVTRAATRAIKLS